MPESPRGQPGPLLPAGRAQRLRQGARRPEGRRLPVRGAQLPHVAGVGRRAPAHAGRGLPGGVGRGGGRRRVSGGGELGALLAAVVLGGATRGRVHQDPAAQRAGGAHPARGGRPGGGLVRRLQGDRASRLQAEEAAEGGGRDTRAHPDPLPSLRYPRVFLVVSTRRFPPQRGVHRCHCAVFHSRGVRV